MKKNKNKNPLRGSGSFWNPRKSQELAGRTTPDLPVPGPVGLLLFSAAFVWMFGCFLQESLAGAGQEGSLAERTQKPFLQGVWRPPFPFRSCFWRRMYQHRWPPELIAGASCLTVLLSQGSSKRAANQKGVTRETLQAPRHCPSTVVVGPLLEKPRCRHDCGRQ